MPTVYVPNTPATVQPDGTFLPTLSFRDAERYGSLTVLSYGPLGAADIPELLSLTALTVEVQMEREDYILCVGDVVVLSGFIAYALRRIGRARLLRWCKRKRRYDLIEINEPLISDLEVEYQTLTLTQKENH